MIDEEIIHYLSQFVRTIFRRNHDGKLQFLGSGFTVIDNNHSYLVTATHVMDSFSEETPLYFDRGVGNTITPINGNEYSVFSLDPENNYLDAAIVELEGRSEISSQLNISIKLEDIDLNQKYDKLSGCIAIGHPAKMNKKNVVHDEQSISPELYALYTFEAEQEKYDELSVNPIDHILMHWNKKKAYSVTRTQRTAPDLNGLSGTPIWGVGDGAPKVVGMLTEYHGRDVKAILGVRARPIKQSIQALTSHFSGRRDRMRR